MATGDRQIECNRPQRHELQLTGKRRSLPLKLQPRHQGAIEHPLAHQLQPAVQRPEPRRGRQQPATTRQQRLQEHICAKAGHAGGEAMGTAAEPQQPHRLGGSIATAHLTAPIRHQGKVRGEGAGATAHCGLTDRGQSAGLKGGATELQQIQQTDVLQQGRQAVTMSRSGYRLTGEFHRNLWGTAGSFCPGSLKPA